MRHTREPNELFEIAGNELRAVVRDNAGLRFRVLFLGAFENYFDIRFRYGLSQIPMREETAEYYSRCCPASAGNASLSRNHGTDSAEAT